MLNLKRIVHNDTINTSNIVHYLLESRDHNINKEWEDR